MSPHTLEALVIQGFTRYLIELKDKSKFDVRTAIFELESNVAKFDSYIYNASYNPEFARSMILSKIRGRFKDFIPWYTFGLGQFYS